jgi:hypothetical protein
MSRKFWLYEWIDQNGISSPRAAARVLKDKKALSTLHEFAAAVPYTTEQLPRDIDSPIVAGRAIDLSGALDCSAFDCLVKQIDNLFSRVWHYFDEIVVEGLSPYNAAKMIESGWDHTKERIETHVRLLLHIRDIGAEDLLIFRQKAPACVLHYRQHLAETKLEGLLDNASWLIDQLAQQGQLVEIRQHDDHWHYTFDHPMLEHRQWGSFRLEEGSTDPATDPNRAVAEAIFKEYSAHLVSDVRTANYLSSPLAASVSLHSEVLDLPRGEVTEAEVALELSLPVLQGVPAAELIKVRRDEALSFERFRSSLRGAIQERLSNAQGRSSAEVASSVVDDVVNPALNEIQQRLGAAQELLAKKSAVSLGLGATSTTIGLIAGMPLLLPAGVAWALLPGQHYMKYLEEKRDIQLSDMYFLWRQEQVVAQRGRHG